MIYLPVAGGKLVCLPLLLPKTHLHTKHIQDDADGEISTS
jgi:hypothetical protein